MDFTIPIQNVTLYNVFMRLKQLLDFENIIIQSHDNPDADALASGFGVCKYLKAHGKNVSFVYGGNFDITKSNLKLMIAELGIDIVHARSQYRLSELLGIGPEDCPDLIITVDSQYGEGNIQKFMAKEYAVIDHHQVAEGLPKLSEVRSYQASCSSVVWDMLRAEDYDVNADINLSTALYYGLLTDSNNFSELHHPLDMDMRDEIKFSSAVITKFKNSNITQAELRIAGIALLGSEYYTENNYSIVKSDPCDPNVLGIISDMLLEVEDVDCCLVYSIHESGIKISVRSCVKEVKADELAKFICEGVGNGGGHVIKAGGSIQRKLLELQELEYTEPSIQNFFRTRMAAYFKDSDIIYASEYQPDISSMEKYVRKQLSLGYVKTSDICPATGTYIIRTMEGDMEIDVRDNTVLGIGIRGEIHPMSEEHFIKNYETSSEVYTYPGQYVPTIRNITDGSSKELLPHVKSCIYKGGRQIYVRELKNRTKIFAKRNPDNYCLGNPGDYLAIAADDYTDICVIERQIFLETFEKYN